VRPPGGTNGPSISMPDEGLRVLHNNKEITAVEASKIRLSGFSGIAIWGDTGPGNGQTIWVDDVSVVLGGPVKLVSPPGEANPYDEKTIAAEMATRRPTVVYTKANAPPTPKIDDLPLKESVSQYGITWTFEQPARVGMFINGDWYVVGPVTIKASNQGRSMAQKFRDASWTASTRSARKTSACATVSCSIHPRG